MLIPWNEKDIETCQHEVNLDATIESDLADKGTVCRSPIFPRPSPFGQGAPEGLRKTLVEIKMNLLSLGEVEKAIAGSPLPVPTLPVPGWEADEKAWADAKTRRKDETYQMPTWPDRRVLLV